MSHADPQTSTSFGGNVVRPGSSEAQKILSEIRSLKRNIIDAWQA